MEGDALGSQLGLYHLLRRLGKSVVLVNDDAVPYGYEFLPHIGRLVRLRHGMAAPGFDCFCIVDCSDLSRAGQVGRFAAGGSPVINIDHHISNSLFGSVNFVDPDASCCCELIWRLYKKLGQPLDRTASTLLYTGILTDTGSFRYTNTTATTHAIVSELLGHGVDAPAIWRRIYATVPSSDLRLLARVLPTMQTRCKGRVVYFEIRRSLLAEFAPARFDLSESVLSFGRSLDTAQVVLLFKENPEAGGGVRVNFRSHGAVDVNRIAKAFGGGGHTTAAGATIHASLARVKRSVLAAVAGALR
jgi:phosphoesterase RecJ-like protein